LFVMRTRKAGAQTFPTVLRHRITPDWALHRKDEHGTKLCSYLRPQMGKTIPLSGPEPR